MHRLHRILTSLTVLTLGVALPCRAGEQTRPAPTRPGARGLPPGMEARITVDGEEVSPEDMERRLPKRIRVRCPVCDLALMVRPRSLRFSASESDRDLCPHPTGAKSPVSELIVCPRCGFSGTERQHARGLSDERAQWVRTHLTPRTQRAIRDLLTRKLTRLQLQPDELWKIFRDDTQENAEDQVLEELVPDTIRSANALAFAERFYPESYAVRARLTWLTAWSHRRVVAAPIPADFLMRALRRIQTHLDEASAYAPAPKDRVNELASMFQDSERFGLVDRQVIRLMMAGDYERLGYLDWAAASLQRCRNSARNDQGWEEAIREGTDAGANPPEQAVMQQRNEIIRLASQRLESNREEARLLGEAAELLRKALRQELETGEVYPPKHIPAMVYLVGEFERRAGRPGRAYAWLDAASELHPPGDHIGVEIFALDQISALRTALGDDPIPPNPQMGDDGPMLQALAARLREASTSEAEAAPAAQAPATPDRP